MAELSLLVKLVGNSASLDRATASGTKGLAAVGGAIGTADDAVRNFAGGVVSLGDALGALGGIAAGKALAGFAPTVRPPRTRPLLRQCASDACSSLTFGV